MDREKKILIVGGDKRQNYLSELFKNEGIVPLHINSKEYLEAEKLIGEYKIIVFPIPVTKDKIHIFSNNEDFNPEINKFFSYIKTSTMVFGAGFDKKWTEHFEKEGILCFDMLKSEVFSLNNAFLTSQGALRLLLDNTDDCVRNKKVLITGFGKISMFLSKMLFDLNMKVTVAARNEYQLFVAENSGYETVKISDICNNISEADFIFNTVPFEIFSEKNISELNNDCIYFELASVPFGVNKNHFVKYGKNFVSGSGLPGKYLSEASAKLMKDYIEKYI